MSHRSGWVERDSVTSEVRETWEAKASAPPGLGKDAPPGLGKDAPPGLGKDAPAQVSPCRRVKAASPAPAGLAVPWPSCLGVGAVMPWRRCRHALA
jgi:hypothetical protein